MDLDSTATAKNAAFDMMNTCLARMIPHTLFIPITYNYPQRDMLADSEVGSLLCQLSGREICVWLRADDISTRLQLDTALRRLYPRAEDVQSCRQAVTVINLRGKQYFYFPPNSDFSDQGNVPWREATAQGTHILITL